MPSITILPESDDYTLCLQLTGLVSGDEFDRSYRDEIRQRIARNGYFNMLVHYDRYFKGWEPDAADKNLKAIIELGPKAGKLAYVNPQPNKIMLMKLTQPIVSGEIRYFDEKELDQALKWVKE